FSPQLGDGRALLLGEVIDVDGRRRDIHLKGSGRTPFSRGGDGKAVLGPVLREYLIGEAMHALGIPTTRALAAVTTGEAIFREGAKPVAVLARVASSHLRVGTFQFFAARGDVDALRLLADHVIARHYPEALAAENPYRQLIEAVIARQGELVARWLLVGFIHGVMNTDNTSVAGETIDYGPCAFIDRYHPETVFSSIDQMGRYAYGNQPAIAQWNLARFAETLLPLIGGEKDEALAWATRAVEAFAVRFVAAYEAGLRAKLGLHERADGDLALANDLLARMAANKADFTLTFRRLAAAAENPAACKDVASLFVDGAAFDDWAERWRARIAAEGGEGAERRRRMEGVNPAFIPRNHLIENVIEAAVARDDFEPFDRMLSVLERPFEDQPDAERYALPPEPHEVVEATFCGT
ncbi:MAG: YdiU family protein, partial [Hyphomicrobiaceae bacterium]|nr:YdiU family protein [Hyphomicrobiaceae bacterium]